MPSAVIFRRFHVGPARDREPAPALSLLIASANMITFLLVEYA
jgi:hypothetical protein